MKASFTFVNWVINNYSGTRGYEHRINARRESIVINGHVVLTRELNEPRWTRYVNVVSKNLYAKFNNR